MASAKYRSPRSRRKALSCGREASWRRSDSTTRSAGSLATGRRSTTWLSSAGVYGAASAPAVQSASAATVPRRGAAPGALTGALLGAEDAVAGVAEAGQDVAVLVELAVDRGGVDRHV